VKLVLRYFLRGLIVIVPAAITVWVLYQVFVTLDSLVGLPYPGAGVGLTLLVILVIGFLASNIVTRKLFEWTEMLFSRAPLAKIIYNAIRDLVEAFVGEQRRFNRPAVVELDATSAVKVIGFITRDSINSGVLAGHVAVYFPQSYNFAGNLAFVPADRVQPLDIDPTQAMTLIVSGGVSGTL